MCSIDAVSVQRQRRECAASTRGMRSVNLVIVRRQRREAVAETNKRKFVFDTPTSSLIFYCLSWLERRGDKTAESRVVLRANMVL